MNERKAALVTGAAHRVGRAIALHLAREGWDIGIHHNRSGAQAEETAHEAQAFGAKTQTFACDLADVEAVERLAAEFCEAFPDAALLVNSAAVFERDTAETFDSRLFDRHMAINARAPVLLAKAFHSCAPQQTCIINVLDQKIASLTPDYFSYTLSKCALDAATRMLAMGLAPKTRVNAIAPGILLQSGDLSREEFQRLHRDTILGIGASMEELCAAVSFFARSPAVTGQVLVIDGGRHLVRTYPYEDLPKLKE
ncbi:MAG: SDR family oxidoreductase [Alphaproteobacteria bacterium]|nr:MAG: SDR family oxidoreductase [Alphaproteobacteria bacterium]